MVYADQASYLTDATITNAELCAEKCSDSCWMANYNAYSYPPATPTYSYTYCLLNYGQACKTLTLQLMHQLLRVLLQKNEGIMSKRNPVELWSDRGSRTGARLLRPWDGFQLMMNLLTWRVWLMI